MNGNPESLGENCCSFQHDYWIWCIKLNREKFLCLQTSSNMHNLSIMISSSYIHLYIDARSPHLTLPWTMLFHFYTERFNRAVLDWHFLLAAGRMFNCKSVGYLKEKCPVVCCFSLLRLSGTQPTTFKWGLNVLHMEEEQHALSGATVQIQGLDKK